MDVPNAEPWDSWDVPADQPPTKEGIANQVQEAASGFASVLEKASENLLVQPGAVGDWSARECLAHCVIWCEYCEEVLRRSLHGTFRAEDFYYGEEIEDPRAYNAVTVEAESDVAVEELLSRLAKSSADVAALLRALPREEFESRRRYRQVVAGTITDHLAEHGSQLQSFLGR